VRGRQVRAAADGPDFETREANGRVQAAVDPTSRAVRHRRRRDHPEVLSRRREHRRDCGGRRERDRLHAGCNGAVRPRPRQRLEIGGGRAQHPCDRLIGQRHFRDDRLAVTGLEELVRRLLVAAHVRLEHRPLDRHRHVRQDERHVQRIGVARHHVRPDRVPRREPPQHVAHRPDDVRLHLAQHGVARQLRYVRVAQERARVVDAVLDPTRNRERIGGVAADKTGRARDPIGDDVCAEAARELGGLRAALHRGGQPALGVRERHRHVFVGP
jgi:hypothetical protein